MVQADAARITQIVGLNAIKSAARYVANNNNTYDQKYLNNPKCLAGYCIFELMYNASIGGNGNYTTNLRTSDNFSDLNYMSNLTLSRWDQQMTQLANQSNFNINISRDNIGVFQSDPWSVEIGYNLYLNVSDRASDAVSRSEIIPILVSVPIINYTVGG
jgi:hypothetical protein